MSSERENGGLRPAFLRLASIPSSPLVATGLDAGISKVE